MRLLISMIVSLLLLVGCNFEEATISNDQTNDHSVVSAGEMRLHFIDVGQGDSILIEAPNGQTMLIDGGTKGAGKKVVDYLTAQQISELHYVVATHPDADHIGGLISVLQSVPIHQFIDSGKVHTSATYEEMLTLIHSKNIPFHVPQTGDFIDVDEALTIEVLSADENAQDNNEASIVLKMTYDQFSALLTGDAGIEMEEQMMLTQNVSATVLKAGHHGSNTSSSRQFIEQVRPEVAILSYGQNNSYGHPHAEVIESLRQVNSKIYGTAESGDIVITTDGKNYEVRANEWTGIGASSSISSTTKGNETVVISSKDVVEEMVGIQNKGTTPVNLSGWQLVSVEGNQRFDFPDMTLQPNETIYITSGSDAKEGNGYIKWTGRQIWLNSGDPAQLINPKGEIVSEFE